MDFYQIGINEKKTPPQIFPDWLVVRSKDLMVRAQSFYAIWDEERKLWSRDEYDVQRLVDADLHDQARKLEAETATKYSVANLRSYKSTSWTSFRRFMASISDNSHELDQTLTFSNMEVEKEDFVSKKLPYPLQNGTTDAWDELMGVLYTDVEREKIEWAIGSIVSGDSKWLQKFLVLYGPAGSGKSTVLNIIQKLFVGYCASFDAKALGSNNNQFASEVFRANPLVAIQHDGDLSNIQDNTKLNSIISHEEMTINEKFKPSYTARINAFLFMGTNLPVKISDSKSGIIRRLIDVSPSGHKVEATQYQSLMKQIEFELGAIAYKCLEVYKTLGFHYYDGYRPIMMMFQTDVFFNFVEAHNDIFKRQDGVTLKQAWDLYKIFCDEAKIDKPLPLHKFRSELENYFESFEARAKVDGADVRSYFSGFKSLLSPDAKPESPQKPFELKHTPSLFDSTYLDQPAQYAKQNGAPGLTWADNKTRLKDLDTSKLHFVKVPENHIVIDFDLVNEDGEKDLQINIEAASGWPLTYAEVSKSGHGLHLHYLYPGDVRELANVYDVGIEIKTLLGDGSLRRKLTLCNEEPIAVITGGLPLKVSPVLDHKVATNEKGMRTLIERNLRKEIHPGTKPSIDFIHKILEDAYNEGVSYDLTDLRPRVISFAASSTNQSKYCMNLVTKMPFKGKEESPGETVDSDEPLVFFDVEVYPNLFVICWKYRGDPKVVRMINPTAQDVAELFKLKLVGFHNRGYDNHILYAAYLGYDNKALFQLSQKIVDNDRSALFGEAYNLSYADIYDFSSKKQGLKKFQIELGIHHVELDLPWDQPVPDEKVELVCSYCENDVTSTEVVFESRYQDFVARQILASLSGLSVNHTTQNHTAKIIFGSEKNPQTHFVYTNLSEMFPGYVYDFGVSTYRGETVGEGGYVYAEPGIYENVALLDVASMHPTSIEKLNLFGPFTPNFSALKDARMAIKHKEYEKARHLLDGKLGVFLVGAEDDPSGAEALSYALKIVINIVYGLTSARFPNAFKDNRNVDNIVAKRGALFMIDLKHALQEKGVTVAHIKTDSVKIPNATPEIIQFVMDFGRRFGYDFEHEATYEKFCLVNDAVYIARSDGEWTAVGAQFQHPYVFKTLFTHEALTFDDFCETKSVTKGRMYLNFTGAEDISDMIHVGRTGSFVPVLEGGGVLLRIQDDKQYAVVGTKGYRWIEREAAAQREEKTELFVDMEYFEQHKRDAIETIENFGSFESFVS